MPVYTVADAKREAVKYCRKHPKWELICNIKDTNSLSLSFNELPIPEQSKWLNAYLNDTDEAWSELGNKPSRHPFKHISGAGEIFDNCLDVPFEHQSMMIFNRSKTRKGGYDY